MLNKDEYYKFLRDELKENWGDEKGYWFSLYNFFDPLLKKQLEKNKLYVGWKTGGKSGSSCWDNAPEDVYDDKEYSTGYSQPDVWNLHLVLQKFAPNIPMKKLQHIFDMVKHESFKDDSDYYGEEYYYEFVHIDAESLFWNIAVLLEEYED